MPRPNRGPSVTGPPPGGQTRRFAREGGAFEGLASIKQSVTFCLSLRHPPHNSCGEPAAGRGRGKGQRGDSPDIFLMHGRAGVKASRLTPRRPRKARVMEPTDSGIYF